jgi:geranylgeranyl diphosphate synthase type 3
MSQSSGDWFSGKKPAVSSITAANIAAGPSRPTSNENSISPHASPDKRVTYLASASQPPPDPLKGIGNDLIYQQHNTWSPEKEKILLGPFDYMFGQPGKDIRAQLIAAFNAWLKVPERSLSIITKVVGMLHTASLL